jgi:hypothetical protein
MLTLDFVSPYCDWQLVQIVRVLLDRREVTLDKEQQTLYDSVFFPAYSKQEVGATFAPLQLCTLWLADSFLVCRSRCSPLRRLVR